MKLFLFIFLLYASVSVSSQNNLTLNKFSVELNGGDFSTKTTQNFVELVTRIINTDKYAPRINYFYYYQGKVNLNLLLYYPLSKNFDLSIDQNYARISNNSLNNRTTLYFTTLNANVRLFSKDKFDIRLSAGLGFETIHIKNLYDFYPFVNNIYGIPLKVIISLNYKLSDKLTVLCNSDLIYSFLFFNKYIGTNSEYYQASFNSINLGFRYYFGKKQKNNEK